MKIAFLIITGVLLLCSPHSFGKSSGSGNGSGNAANGAAKTDDPAFNTDSPNVKDSTAASMVDQNGLKLTANVEPCWEVGKCNLHTPTGNLTQDPCNNNQASLNESTKVACAGLGVQDTERSSPNGSPPSEGDEGER